MNKTHKAIAGIIKKKIDSLDSKVKGGGYEEKKYMDAVTKNIQDITFDLARYFKKKDHKEAIKKCEANNITYENWRMYSDFEEEQFLKLAGVN